MQSNPAMLANGVATYRLQLNKDFTLHDATTVVEYLKALGISHLYLSPVLESVQGSNHGYDVADFTKVSAERGGEAALLALDRTVRAHDLGIILDIVPNHMASSLQNPFWCDVLRHGQQSKYWQLFDFRVGDDNKLHLPILDTERKPGMVTMGAAADGLPVLSVDSREIPVAPATADRLIAGAAAAGQDLEYYLKNLPAALLEEAIVEQPYKLVHWREMTQHMSYRRFFNITDLVGVRMEDPEIFTQTHAKIFELLKTCPTIQGLRIDHIDGLLDPTAYLQKLATTMPEIWVEKILAPGEAMRADWPVRGTSGYEFGEHLHPLFTQSGGFILIEDYWRGQIKSTWANFPACVFAAKREVINNSFASERNRLAALNGLADAADFWTAITVGLGVYRTYITDQAPDASDQRHIRAAVQTVKKFDRWSPQWDAVLATLLKPQTPNQFQAAREWQQLSGAVMAKGLEDTAHYRYTPLTALNEVGCQPIQSDSNPATFYEWLNTRARDWPQSLNATTTHDTKRNEDVRYRLLALTEMPGDWIALFERLEKRLPPALDRATIYFILQTIVGAWPFDNAIDDDYRARIKAYLQKSMREAKSHTNWSAPDQAYEGAVVAAIDFFLTDSLALDDLQRFVQPLQHAGALNTLTAQALKILSPGIPDLYQGTELWNLSLVDPDNRRPVDYPARRALLTKFKNNQTPALLDELTTNWRDGAIKLWLTQKLLAIRRDHLNAAFAMHPVTIQGPRADHLIAYTLTPPNVRERGLLVVAPRFTHHLRDPAQDNLSLSPVDWRGTQLEFSHAGENLLTGEKLSDSEIMQPGKLFAQFPLAVVAF